MTTSDDLLVACRYRMVEVARCLDAVGYDVRFDWSDFDGRAHKRTLASLSAALRDPLEPFNADEWITEWCEHVKSDDDTVSPWISDTLRSLRGKEDQQ